MPWALDGKAFERAVGQRLAVVGANVFNGEEVIVDPEKENGPLIEYD